MALTVEHDNGHVADLDVAALGDQRAGLGDWAVKVEQIGDVACSRQLLHVDAGAGVEHRPARRNGDHGQRARHSLRCQRRSFERIDRNVDLRVGAVADVLSVEEHRRLILLTLADYNDTVHRNRVEHKAHRVNGGLIGSQLVAHAHQSRRRERSGFGYAHQFKGEISIWGSMRVGHQGFHFDAARRPYRGGGRGGVATTRLAALPGRGCLRPPNGGPNR